MSSLSILLSRRGHDVITLDTAVTLEAKELGFVDATEYQQHYILSSSF